MNIGIYTYMLAGTRNYMIGETEVKSGENLYDACKERMKQYLNPKAGITYGYSDLKCFLIPSRKKNHADTDFRKFILEHYSLARIVLQEDNGHKTEMLSGVTREDIDEAMTAWTSGNLDIYRTNSFPLYNYQQKLADRIIPYMQEHNRCLIHLSTRGGKSFLSLTVARELGAKNILIVTPFPSAVDSFRTVVTKHMDFIGWSFFNKQDTKEDTIYQPEHNVVLLSWQIFDTESKKKKIQNLFSQVNFDTIIIDETHHTSNSMRSEDILKIVNPDNSLKEIHLSGTPYNDILSARFSDEETFTLDFIDLLTLDQKTHCVNFPKLSIFNICNMDFLNRTLSKIDPTIFEREEGFSLEKVFATESRARIFLTWVFTKVFNIEDEYFLDETEEISRNFFNGRNNKHILLRVPNLQAANFTKKILDELVEKATGYFAKYRICQVSGETDSGNDIDTSAGDLERQVNEFQQNNDYTITITCGKLTTGVTLKKCDCILQMRKTSSAETFVQVLFRAMTPAKNKTEARLYNFDAESMLQVVRETIRVRKETHPDQTDIEGIKELFRVFNIRKFWADKTLNFDITEPEEYLGAIKKLATDLNCNRFITNFPKLTTEQLAAIKTVIIEEFKNAVSLTSARGGIKQKNSKRNAKPIIVESDDESKSIDITKDIENRIRSMFTHLDWTVVLNDITTFDDLYNNIQVDVDDIGNIKLVRI